MRKIIFIIAMSLSGSPLFGHFFKIQTMSNDRQTIILVSDYHYSHKPENENYIFTQQQEIIDIAQKLDALVISEDGYIENDQEIIKDSSAFVYPKVIPYHEIDSKVIQTPLHALHSLCSYYNVPSINVESRFSQFRTTSNFLTYLENKKHSILSYDDPENFQKIYRKIFQWLSKCFEIPCKKTIDVLKNKHDTISQLSYRRNKINSRATLVKAADAISIDTNKINYDKLPISEALYDLYVHYGCMFLDMEILHAIAQHQDKKYIIVCAGDYHIEHCTQLLHELGYTRMQSIGEDLELIEEIDYCEPEAISMSVITNLCPRFEQNKTLPTSFCISLLEIFMPFYNFYLSIH